MKKGQIQVTFNWFYILIAGGVILLFFVGIIVRQKAISEDHLAIDVVQLLDTVLKSAQASENTKRFINTAGLVDYTLYFRCQDQVGEFGIDGRSGALQDTTHALFGPETISSYQLITWSLPYRFPFKVTDLLLFTSPDHVYVVAGSISAARDLLNDTEDLDFRYVTGEFPQISSEKIVRLIDLDGTLTEGTAIPTEWENLEQLTAVSFVGTQVTYLENQRGIWQKTKSQERNPILVANLPDERAAKYAAIFAANPDVYQCNMHKAFTRLNLIMDVYNGMIPGTPGGKMQELLLHYEGQPSTRTARCLGPLRDNDQNLVDELASFSRVIDSCLARGQTCADMLPRAQSVRELNEELQGCVQLY